MNLFAKAFATIALAAAAALSSQAANAHTELVSSNPAANSVLATAPDSVTLTFGEKLMVMAGADAANQIQVTDGAKARVDNADSKVTGEVLTVSLKPGLSDGTYTVDYRVVSEDGHPIEGVYQFDVNGMARSGEATPMAIDDQSPAPILYSTKDESANGTAIGIGVAVGAVLVATAMFFLFRRLKRN